MSKKHEADDHRNKDLKCKHHHKKDRLQCILTDLMGSVVHNKIAIAAIIEALALIDDNFASHVEKTFNGTTKSMFNDTLPMWNSLSFEYIVPEFDQSKPFKVYVGGYRMAEGSSRDYTVVSSTMIQFMYDIRDGGLYEPNIVIDYYTP